MLRLQRIDLTKGQKRFFIVSAVCYHLLLLSCLVSMFREISMLEALVFLGVGCLPYPFLWISVVYLPDRASLLWGRGISGQDAPQVRDLFRWLFILLIGGFANFGLGIVFISYLPEPWLSYYMVAGAVVLAVVLIGFFIKIVPVYDRIEKEKLK